MATKATKNDWKWTVQREEAASLVALDQLSDAEIANQLGLHRATLHTWKNTTEFADRVAEHVAAHREAIRTTGIAIIENRVARKQADWERLQAVVAARAASAAHDAEWLAQGGFTGIVVRKERALGQGPLAQIVTDYGIDTAYLSAMEQLEEATAKELGQRVEKREVETRDMSAADGLDSKIEALARRLSPATQTENTENDGSRTGPAPE